MYRIILAGVCGAALSFASSARAAEAVENAPVAKPAGEPSAIDKLVANRPTTPAATSSDAPDQPMTINFSDFVKDGAGCGVPNLDTSNK